MKEEEILKNNKLIAEFMGCTLTKIPYRDGGSFISVEFNAFEQDDICSDWCIDSDLLFHKSWDWLMPAAKKTTHLSGLISVDQEEYPYNTIDDIRHALAFGDINSLYKETVKFIKGYNESKV